MEVIYVNNRNREAQLVKANPCVMALGFFDGMHVGHREVINRAKQVADKEQLPLVCMSFFPHPKEVLTNGRQKVNYLMPMVDKQKILQQLGVEKFYIIQFDSDFAVLSPKQFVQKYLIDYQVQHVVAGFDFTYGYRGEGNMDRVKEDANQKLDAVKVGKVEFEGDKISSTLIREKICTGRMELIHHYLGKHYQIEGDVCLSEKNAQVIVNPYYLIPCTGLYEVIISNGMETWKQTVVVEKDAIKMVIPHTIRSTNRGTQSVRIMWLKRLTSEVSAAMDDSFTDQTKELVNN